MNTIYLTAIGVLYKGLVRPTLKKLAKRTDNNVDDYMLKMIDIALRIKVK